MRTLSLLILSAHLTIPLAAQAAPSRPHVILVMADDQGLGDMGYTGHPKLKTPNFDAAAAAGLRFERFYAAAPVCSPTRASVLTGRHPNRMGVFRWGYSMRPQEWTLAEVLGDAGYATAHFGKWHLGAVRRGSPDSPGANGFDEWLSASNYYDNNGLLSRRGRIIRSKGESSMVAVDAAIEWMAGQKDGADPMFCVIWFGSPHAPHRAAEIDKKPYADVADKRLRNFYGEVTGMDRAFGKLRDQLGAWGIRDNTLLWYCSDNGALPKVGSTAGLRSHKGKVYEGGLRVPAFLEWPARYPKPRAIEPRCSTTDIYPTLLSLLGIEVAQQPPLDGKDLSGVLAGTASPDQPARQMGFWDRDMRGKSVPSEKRLTAVLRAQQQGQVAPMPVQSKTVGHLPDPPHPLDSFSGHAAWIDGDWKLHRRQDRNGKVVWELYDLAKDPKEQSDRVAAEPARVAAMRKALRAWLESVVHSFNGADY